MSSKRKQDTFKDILYRLTFERETVELWRSNDAMRAALKSARRFVADDRMAMFMAELANEAFLKARSNKLCCRIVDSLRIQARVPHEAIWIEYPIRPYQVRSSTLRGSVNNPSEQPLIEGWLIQQHPKISTAAIMHTFVMDDRRSPSGDYIFTFPYAYAWTCDDSIPLPWFHDLEQTGYLNEDEKPDRWLSENLLGIRGYKTLSCGIVRSPLIKSIAETLAESPRSEWKMRITNYYELLCEWSGTLRRTWALLAALDNLPLTYGPVRQSAGFLARGQIRKGLEHRTITLNLPAHADTRTLARRAIATIHRKRHEVRGHWRDDWRHPAVKKCNPHLWEFVDNDPDHIECSVCKGRQIFIPKHERGDEKLGRIIHDYKLQH